MLETRFTWKWLFVVAALGIAGGVVLGLIVGWAFPISPAAATDPSALNANAQNDYIVLVANSYAYDDDLDAAKQRLTLLKDASIKTHVERLAKSLASKKDADAANVADLAVGLGSTDSSLKVLAASVVNNDPNAEPTKVARVQIEPSPTTAPTIAATDTPAATATLETTNTVAAPTRTKAAVNSTPKNTSTPKPAAPTQPPAPAAVLMPAFAPSFPDGWWNGVHFVGASVAPGQQYWRLISALYCDVDDKRNNCPNLPGGTMDHSIYVSVLNPDGTCASATVKHVTNTGDTTPLELKTQPYPWNGCNQDFEWNMYGEGNDIWIDGLPSDKMTGLCLCNVVPPPGTTGILQGHAHVRYYLTFQLTTR